MIMNTGSKWSSKEFAGGLTQHKKTLRITAEQKKAASNHFVTLCGAGENLFANTLTGTILSGHRAASSDETRVPDRAPALSLEPS
jgi:hypothetical protein